jgi:hypothetical protein
MSNVLDRPCGAPAPCWGAPRSDGTGLGVPPRGTPAALSVPPTPPSEGPVLPRPECAQSARNGARLLGWPQEGAGTAQVLDFAPLHLSAPAEGGTHLMPTGPGRTGTT